MTDQISVTGSLPLQELEAVYAISSVIAETVDLDRALEKVIHLSRKVFIFDNIVLYLKDDTESLEPGFARVIGRGRSAQGDLAWGESIASQVLECGEQRATEEILEGWEKERLNRRYMLGLPLRSGNGLMGVLVFGRFGGPPYTPEQIHLSEFIATHVAQLLIRRQLVQRVASLEAEKRLQLLQENFIAMVSHELCTPLGFIKGYATTLLRQDTTWAEETRREFLSIIDEEADHLRKLIDDLLDSSRLQTQTLKMQFQPVRLEVILKEVAQRAVSRYQGLKVDFDVDSTTILQADPIRLAQVFNNLIDNAVKYAPGSPVDINAVSRDAVCRITFQDHGQGIPAEALPHIFKRFYRVSEASSPVRGTGLGLFICREIILAHGGQMRVESTLGLGTAFIIDLPSTNEHPQPFT